MIIKKFLFCFLFVLIFGSSFAIAQQKVQPRNGFLGWLLKQEVVQDTLQRSPMLQFTARLASNEKFTNGFLAVLHFKEWKKLLVLEMIAIILMVVIKSWRFAMLNQDEWLERFFVGIGTTLFSWFLYFIVVPTIMIKKEYLNLLWGTFEVIRG